MDCSSSTADVIIMYKNKVKKKEISGNWSGRWMDMKRKGKRDVFNTKSKFQLSFFQSFVIENC